jgi:hypothetical protein
MANYVIVFKGGSPPTSEEEGAKVMQAWMSWMGGLGQAIVSPGNPFGASTAIAPGGTVTAGAPSGLMGYTVIAAESLAAATELAKDCPHLTGTGTAVAGTVEIYETVEIM